MGKGVVAFVSAALLCAGSIPATASTVILSPVAATASSTFGVGVEIERTIDQSGLSIGFASGVDDFDAYFALGPLHTLGAFGNEWFTALFVTGATVVYDLGAIYDVSQFALWNEDSTGFGVADVGYSTDNDVFSSLGSLSGTDHAIVDYPADLFGLVFTGRYFRMDLRGCPQPIGSGFAGCAIGEVAFGVSTGGDVGVIPVPASLPLLLGALGMMLGLARRRRAV